MVDGVSSLTGQSAAKLVVRMEFKEKHVGVPPTQQLTVSFSFREKSVWDQHNKQGNAIMNHVQVGAVFNFY